jgi:heme exporter protein C
MGKPSMDFDMLIWLLVMLAGFMCFFGAVLLTRTRAEVLSRAREQKWVRQAIERK